MAILLNTNDSRYIEIQNQLCKACKKLERFFLAIPSVKCKVICSNDGYRIKVNLSASGRNYICEEYGKDASTCITGALNHIVRMIENNKDVCMVRGQKTVLKDISLRCKVTQ